MASNSQTSTRAGPSVAQPAGHRAFEPVPLPPEPPLQLAGDLQRLLSDADRPLGRLDGSVATLPTPDLFVFLAAIGVLEEMTGHARNRRFRFGPCIRIFSDAADPSARS